jgi:hypothetical protein
MRQFHGFDMQFNHCQVWKFGQKKIAMLSVDHQDDFNPPVYQQVDDTKQPGGPAGSIGGWENQDFGWLCHHFIFFLVQNYSQIGSN